MHFSRFIAAQAASLVGTTVDFLVTIAGVEVLGLWYVAATALGNVAGGSTNFFLGRHYVFAAVQQQVPGQAARYLLVWLGSLLLNAAGVHLLTQGAGLNYLVSKILTGAVVGLGFNYVLQVKFVFRTV